MAKLRICIGILIGAVLVAALPARAGTIFRTAKVCAQTQSGIKITNVKFHWSYPGTIGGSGTTDSKGCFTQQFLPIGEVTFSNVPFILPHQITPVRQTAISVSVHATGDVLLLLHDQAPIFRNATVCVQTLLGTKLSGLKITWTYPSSVGGSGVTGKTGCYTASYLPIGDVMFQAPSSTLTYKLDPESVITYPAKEITVTVGTTGTVVLPYEDVNPVTASVQALDPDGKPLTSDYYFYSPASYGNCSQTWQTETGRYSLQNTKKAFTFGQITVLPKSQSAIAAQTDYYGKPVTLGHGSTIRYLVRDPSTLPSTGFIIFCLAAVATKGGSQVLAIQRFTDVSTTLHYTNYLAGFSNVPKALSGKSGKVTFTTTLLGDQHQPLGEIPVVITETKSTNPNIGKPLRTCRPTLVTTTNSEGKATFILCPTKNTTVSLKAPTLGLFSDSITVKK